MGKESKRKESHEKGIKIKWRRNLKTKGGSIRAGKAFQLPGRDRETAEAEWEH